MGQSPDTATLMVEIRKYECPSNPKAMNYFSFLISSLFNVTTRASYRLVTTNRNTRWLIKEPPTVLERTRALTSAI